MWYLSYIICTVATDNFSAIWSSISESAWTPSMRRCLLNSSGLSKSLIAVLSNDLLQTLLIAVSFYRI